MISGVMINVMLIVLLAGTIMHAIHTEETFEQKILNIIMIVLLPVLGSVIYIFKSVRREKKDLFGNDSEE